MMKKSAKATSKKSTDTAIQRKAENNITIVTSSIILYALVLAAIQTMSGNSQTAVGAATVRSILMIAGILGAMGIATYAAYKSNKSLLKYAFMCLFVSVSTAGIQYCHYNNMGLKVSVAGLLVAFILTCVYAALVDKNVYYSSKKARMVFRTVSGVIYALLLIVLAVAFVQTRIEYNDITDEYQQIITFEDVTDATL